MLYILNQIEIKSYCIILSRRRKYDKNGSYHRAMNTNKCIYKLAINLVCVMVFLMMPLCSFATEQTEVEIKPPVIQEEHKFTEKKSQD